MSLSEQRNLSRNPSLKKLSPQWMETMPNEGAPANRHTPQGSSERGGRLSTGRACHSRARVPVAELGRSCGMNTSGPNCPKCLKALPYGFAFTLLNPYNFRCPACSARLRSKYITLEILVFAIITAAICWSVHQFYVKNAAWDTTELVVVILGFFPASMLISHFYFWKKDRLICKDAAERTGSS